MIFKLAKIWNCNQCPDCDTDGGRYCQNLNRKINLGFAIAEDCPLPETVELPPYSEVKKNIGELPTRNEQAAARLCYITIQTMIALRVEKKL